MTNRYTAKGATAFALLLALSACGGDAGRDAQQPGAAAQQSPAASSNKPTAVADPAQLEADIARLEREAERNPMDDSARDELARAYVRRGDSHRTAGRLREALLDYQRALRSDPDNEDAQRNAAAISPDVEGEKTGENGEPAPLPITPNVADEEGKPSPTPKKP